MSDGINVSIDTLKGLKSEIDELDGVIEASIGGKSAGKRSLANRLATDQEENATNLFGVVEENFDGLSPEEITGIYTGLIKRMSDKFSEMIDTYLTSQVDAQQASGPSVSEEEANKAMEIRKDKVKAFKTLKQLLEMFGSDVSVVPDPRKWTGSRGPRTFSQYQYSVNGVDLDEENNSLATVAKMGGFEKSTRTNRKGEEVGISASANLKAFLADSAKLDLKNPPDEWTAELPNGVVVNAVKQEVTVDSAYVDDTEDDPEDEEEE